MQNKSFLAEVMANEMSIDSTESSVFEFNKGNTDSVSDTRQTSRKKWKCFIDEEEIRSKVESSESNKTNRLFFR